MAVSTINALPMWTLNKNEVLSADGGRSDITYPTNSREMLVVFGKNNNGEIYGGESHLYPLSFLGTSVVMAEYATTPMGRWRIWLRGTYVTIINDMPDTEGRLMVYFR